MTKPSKTPLDTFRYWVLEIQRGNPPMSFSDLQAFNESAVAAARELTYAISKDHEAIAADRVIERALGRAEVEQSRREAVGYLAGVALGAISYAVNSGNHTEAMRRVTDAQESLIGLKPESEIGHSTNPQNRMASEDFSGAIWRADTSLAVGQRRVSIPQWQYEEIKNDALEFAAQLCECHGRQLVTEDYRQVGSDMASRIRSRKGNAEDPNPVLSQGLSCAECAKKQAFIDAAFAAYPNLDLDIGSAHGDLKP